jgi:16S rRNA (guanine527-N7)-methyltransferase
MTCSIASSRRSALASDARRGAAWREHLGAGAQALLGRPLDAEEHARFAKYAEMLSKWQRVHRLVGSVEPRWIVDHVFLDSLAFLLALPPGALDVADIGSGAGVPGIPMKIVSPALSLALVEARERRVSFLRAVVRELGLVAVEVVAARAERAAEAHDGRHDAAVMRCAGKARQLVPVAERFVRPGGVIVVGAAESMAAPGGAEKLAVDIPGSHVRTLLRFRKA